jgi:CubicO group peptidase (beta-lactamase class C family)
MRGTDQTQGRELNAPAPSFLDATASDPRTLAWMQGAPPPADKVVRFNEMAHLQFPKLRWSVAHMRQMVPTTQIWHGEGPASMLPKRSMDGIDGIAFTTLGGTPMTWEQSLAANYTDAIAVLHRGQLVDERYTGVMAPHRTHSAFSVTKSYTGTLASMLVTEGLLDETKPVPYYIPELAGSAYADASVRNVMDMRIGVNYSEDYTDPAAGIWEHARAGGIFPRPAGYGGAQSFFEYLKRLQKSGAHGQGFSYKTVSSDVLGWLMRRVTGMAFGDLLSQRLWQPLGCEFDADMMVDTEGTEFAGGGLCAALRDLLRMGEAMRCDGAFNGRQVIPAAVVHDIRTQGSVEAFKTGGPPTLPGGAYRAMWWLTNNAHGAFAARGIHGQAIYVDPAAEMVIARFASHPMAANVHLDPVSLPAFHALGTWLRQTHSHGA